MKSTFKLLEQIDKAMETITALNHQEKKWILTVPADPERDPDLIITSALIGAREYILEKENVTPLTLNKL